MFYLPDLFTSFKNSLVFIYQIVIQCMLSEEALGETENTKHAGISTSQDLQ